MRQLLIYSITLLIIFLFGCKEEVDSSDESTKSTVDELRIDPEADKLLKQMSDNLSSAKEYTVRVESSSDFTNDTGEILKLHRTKN